MRSRSLGKTGISVSELSLGTWGLSGEAYGSVSPGESKRVIDRAKAMGITLFETADYYGGGAIETELGEALKGSSATIVTKWGTDVSGSPKRKRFDAEFLRDSALASKKRLGDDAQIIGILHNPSQKALESTEATDAMKKLCEEGLIASWGVSVGDEEVARAAIEQEAPVLSFAHNILQVQPLRDLCEEIKEKEIGVLAHSVLFYGLLAGRWAPNKEFRYGDHRSERWPEGVRARVRHLDGIRPLVSGDVSTMRSAAIRFVLENETVSTAVLGPRTSAQLDQLIRECTAEPPYLSEGKMSALESRLSNMEVPR